MTPTRLPIEADPQGRCPRVRLERTRGELTVTAPVGRGPLDVLVVYVPVGDTDALLRALFDAGAGAVGDYRDCAFVIRGTGQFRPLEGANPTIGVVGELEKVAENRVEVTLERGRRADVVAALRAAHPYEEPAFHVVEAADTDPA